MRMKRLVALLGCLSITFTSGCSTFIREDVASYPLSSPLTKQEVVDYYSKALEYDAVVSKNVTVHETVYETKDITGEKAEKLKALTSQVEALLGKDEYDVTTENLKLLSPDNFGYIKGVLDNEVLNNSKILNITGALGYYFVDVEYDISPKTIGKFNQLTSLAALNGAFYLNPDKTYSLDVDYMKAAVDKVNQYFYPHYLM